MSLNGWATSPVLNDVRDAVATVSTHCSLEDITELNFPLLRLPFPMVLEQI